jgi:glucose/mannose-6-phosphate isomerase
MGMMESVDSRMAYDKSGMLETISRFPDQIKEAVALAGTVERLPFLKTDNIIISGMGGSAISGDIVQALFRDKLDVPLIVNREPDLPKWANKDTLSICLSYSGNTEETINAFKASSQRKCKIISISTGGKLQELSSKRDVVFLKIPADMQPRAATPYLLFPTIVLLHKAGLVKATIEPDLQETIEVTRDFVAANGPKVPEASNPSKQLARRLYGAIPQIYGWGPYAPIGVRWRQQFNENSKIIAREDIVSESNHNDLVGWSQSPEFTKQFSYILFRDRDHESISIATRLDFMKSLGQNVAKDVIEISPKGKSRLARMMHLMCQGDFASNYLALLRGVDPSPVDIVTELKRRLAEKLG